jgi:uroporphyrinogen-III synthase
MSSDLAGMTVAVTASRRANELAHLIASHGGSPYIAPTVGIESNASTDDEALRFCDVAHEKKVDIAIFMSGPGVFSLFSAALGLHREDALREDLSRVKVVARSSKPKDALAKHGVRVDLVPVDATSQGILKSLEGDAQGKSVAVLSHGSDSTLLIDGLRAMGAEVQEFSVYSYSLETSPEGAEILQSMRFNPVMPAVARVSELIEAIIGGKIDMITFTSPPSAANLFEVATSSGKAEELRSTLNSKVIVVAVGPPTRSTIERCGVVVDVTPSVYKMGPMVKEACEHVTSRAAAKGSEGASPQVDGP